MRNIDPSLDRLLRAAGACHTPASREEPPFGFTTRVVAAWLAGNRREGFGVEALWFRRALLCAVAVMALSVGLSFKVDTAGPNDEMAIASYDVTADLP